MVGMVAPGQGLISPFILQFKDPTCPITAIAHRVHAAAAPYSHLTSQAGRSDCTAIVLIVTLSSKVLDKT